MICRTLISIAALGTIANCLLPRTDDRPPNIVFLLADDLGYGDLGCFGSPVIRSPHLDKLAEQGVKLTHCYAASPNCSPARAGLLTGRHPYRVGMYDFIRFAPLHLPDSEVTLAELLQEAGYQTMFAGKWHCSGDFYGGTQPGPGDQGFDHWLAHEKSFTKDAQGFLRNGEALDAVDGWMSEVVVDETIAWLAERDPDKPFFTCLWFSEPHEPVTATRRFKRWYDNEETAALARKLKFGGPQVKRRADRRQENLYFACVSMLDHHIGRLLRYLDEAGLAEDTIVVFTSDNGPEHRTPIAFGSPGNLRGAKGHVQDGGIRVPGIVRWPGRLEAGSVCDEPLNGTDWLPTLCSAAGVAAPSDRVLDGADVLPRLLKGLPVQRERPMFWWLWHARGGSQVAMRDGEYKMLASMAPQLRPGDQADAEPPEGWSNMQFIRKAELEGFELFNLVLDPREADNLAEREAERFERMKRRMIALHHEIRAEGPVYELELDLDEER